MNHKCEFVGGGPADGNRKVIKDDIMAFRFVTDLIPLDDDQIITVPQSKEKHHHIYLREIDSNFFWYEGLD